VPVFVETVGGLRNDFWDWLLRTSALGFGASIAAGIGEPAAYAMLGEFQFDPATGYLAEWQTTNDATIPRKDQAQVAPVWL